MQSLTNKIKTLTVLKQLEKQNKEDAYHVINSIIDKETLNFILSNSNQFTSLSPAEILYYSQFSSDKDIAKLAVEKDFNALNSINEKLFMNRQFVKEIINTSNGQVLNFLKGANQLDQEIIADCILELYVSDKVKEFPNKLKTKTATQTYQKVFDKVCLDNNLYQQMIDFYRQKEYFYYNLAELYGKNQITPEQQAELDLYLRKLETLNHRKAFLITQDFEQEN